MLTGGKENIIVIFEILHFSARTVLYNLPMLCAHAELLVLLIRSYNVQCHFTAVTLHCPSIF